MIERALGFKSGDRFFPFIEDAQRAELVKLFTGKIGAEALEAVASFIVAQREEVVDILTTTPDSRPKARKIHGGKKERKAKAPAAESEVSQ